MTIKIKRLHILVLLLVVLAVGATVIFVSCTNRDTNSTAFTEPTIYVTAQHGAESGEYIVVVSVANNPGIAGYNLALAFDREKLAPIAVTEGNALNGGLIFISNLVGASEERIADMNAVTAVWASARDSDLDGDLYTVTFRAAPTASGRTELELTSRGIGNDAELPVDFILMGTVIDFSGGVGSFGLSGRLIMLLIMLLLIAASSAVWVIHKKRKTG